VRGFLADYDVHVPKSLDEALGLLAKAPGTWRALAGGTDLMVLFEAGKLPPGKYLSLWGMKELKAYEESDECVVLGALTTYSEVRENALLRKEFPLLCHAASETGAIAIQNRGTLGGNIANASPAADSPPALLVYDAEVELVSSTGSRWLPYGEFHLGYKKLALAPAELIRRIRLPRRAPWTRQLYRKVGTRKAQAISKVCLAAAASLEKNGQVKEIRIAFGSVAPIPLRSRKTEKYLTGKRPGPSEIQDALAVLATELTPIDDIRSTAHYRKSVACNLLRHFLESL
jgi:CO/xanthine dehydrogenase FAD-binding subunit